MNRNQWNNGKERPPMDPNIIERTCVKCGAAMLISLNSTHEEFANEDFGMAVGFLSVEVKNGKRSIKTEIKSDEDRYTCSKCYRSKGDS